MPENNDDVDPKVEKIQKDLAWYTETNRSIFEEVFPEFRQDSPLKETWLEVNNRRKNLDSSLVRNLKLPDPDDLVPERFKYQELLDFTPPPTEESDPPEPDNAA